MSFQGEFQRIGLKHRKGWLSVSTEWTQPCFRTKASMRRHVGSIQYRPQIRSKKEKTVPSPSTVLSMPGLCKAMDSNLNFYERLMWACLFITVAAICGYQVWDSIKCYRRMPINLNVKVIQKQMVTFPAVTICPDHSKRKAAVFGRIENALNLIGKNLSDLHKMDFTYKQLNISYSTLGHMEAIWENDIVATTPCPNRLTGEECNIEFPTYKKRLWTLMGGCITLTPAKAMQFRGSITILSVLVKRRAIQALVHNPRNDVVHDAFFLAYPLTENMRLHLILSAKEFSFKNTRSSPCISPEEATKCRNDCIYNRIMKNKAVPCSISFLNMENVRKCQAVRETMLSHFEVEKTYLNLTSEDCQCIRKCHDIVYQSTADTSIHDENNTSIEMQMTYLNNAQEKVEEEYAYSFAALISDISGSLGFYHGFSILEFLEIIVSLLKKISHEKRQ